MISEMVQAVVMTRFMTLNSIWYLIDDSIQCDHVGLEIGHREVSASVNRNLCVVNVVSADEVTTMSSDWHQPEIGDRIRIVRMPTDDDGREQTLHAETRVLYQPLIERGRSLRISRIDGGGLPWIECRFKLPDGRWEYHYLMINDNSWVPVIPRT